MSAYVPAEVARVEALLRESMGQRIADGVHIVRDPGGWFVLRYDGPCACAAGSILTEPDDFASDCEVADKLKIAPVEVIAIASGFDGDRRDLTREAMYTWYDCGARLAAYAVEQGWL